MNVLVIDVGGSHVKYLIKGQAKRRFESSPKLTGEEMVAGVKRDTQEWSYNAVSIGYPGPVLNDKPVAEPVNLGGGWVGLDYEAAFGCAVKVINDAAMQALGSYEGGKMLFLGLGTGLGSAMIVDGIIQPMELGHLPYRKRTYEDYVGAEGLERLGHKKWRRFAEDVIEKLTAALQPDYIVLGGGNAEELKSLPPKCRLGDNANAFTGGFRLWEDPGETKSAGRAAASG